MKLRAYLTIVVSLGLVVLGLSAGDLARAPIGSGWLVLAGLAILTGSFKLDFASVSATISVSDTFFITIAMLFGPGPAAIAIAFDSLVISLRKKDPWVRMAFNVTAPALSLWAGARVCFLMAGAGPLALDRVPVGTLAMPLVALALVYFVLNSGLTAVAVALEARQSAFAIWQQHFMWLSVGYLAAASAAFCLLLLVQQVSFAAAVMVLPLLAVFHLTLRASFGRLKDATRHLSDLDRLYLSTIETLAMAIDAKDDVTHNHVRRVQAYSVGLAQALGITDELELKALKAAALLHDTGKLAVPEHILNKPGKLTESEFEKMKRHVEVGADILSLVHFPYPVVPIVRAHHESWNGTGYPRGLRGEAIPIGARILSVVDCFDALTSDRPYRRALSDEAACAILVERSGTMYDPRVVDTFIAIHRDITVEGTDTAEQRKVLRRIVDPGAGAQPGPEAPPPESLASASSELLVFVSLARMAAGDCGVPDVLALTSNLIRGMMPAATGAWYLPDDANDRLVVAEAFGPAAHVVAGGSVGVGQRLTGWVASSRQPILGSDAALDLESRALAATPALTSCLSVPLLAGDVLVGVLTLYASSTEPFDGDRGRALEMVAPHIAAALHTALRRDGVATRGRTFEGAASTPCEARAASIH